MQLSTRFHIYLALLHIVMGAVVGWALWKQHEPGLAGALPIIAAELFFVLSLLVGRRFVDALFVPIRLVATGADLIDERDFASTFQPSGQPEMDRLVAVYNRMIVELREERLSQQEQEAFLHLLVEASPVGIVICDLEGEIYSINAGAHRLLGIAAKGSRLSQLPTPWNRSLIKLESAQSSVVSLTDGRRVRCQAGEFRHRGFPRRFFLLEELSEELRRSEKAAYEKLIRMMSHEVNNSVGAVSSLLGSLGHYAEQLKEDDQEDFEHALDVATTRLFRLQSFMDGFADVVRLPEPHRQPLDVDELVDDLLTLFTPTLTGLDLRAERVRRDPPLRTSADRQQLEQVLLNILKNAAEATVARESTDAADRILKVITQLDETGRPSIIIEDRGPGIAAEVATQLFTPFFTTKDDGCGLGLTLVKEILLRHDFRFTLESIPGPDPACPVGGRFVLRF